MHHAYVIPNVVDAAVVREQAARRLRDKYNPEESTVHYHRHGEHCDERCEVYTFDRLEEDNG
jgi:hypothetical protein